MSGSFKEDDNFKLAEGGFDSSGAAKTQRMVNASGDLASSEVVVAYGNITSVSGSVVQTQHGSVTTLYGTSVTPGDVAISVDSAGYINTNSFSVFQNGTLASGAVVSSNATVEIISQTSFTSAHVMVQVSTTTTITVYVRGPSGNWYTETSWASVGSGNQSLHISSPSDGIKVSTSSGCMWSVEYVMVK
jgi:hypothetical protein